MDIPTEKKYKQMEKELLKAKKDLKREQIKQKKLSHKEYKLKYKSIGTQTDKVEPVKIISSQRQFGTEKKDSSDYGISSSRIKKKKQAKAQKGISESVDISVDTSLKNRKIALCESFESLDITIIHIGSFSAFVNGISFIYIKKASGNTLKICDESFELVLSKSTTIQLIKNTDNEEKYDIYINSNCITSIDFAPVEENKITSNKRFSIKYE